MDLLGPFDVLFYDPTHVHVTSLIIGTTHPICMEQWQTSSYEFLKLENNQI